MSKGHAVRLAKLAAKLGIAVVALGVLPGCGVLFGGMEFTVRVPGYPAVGAGTGAGPTGAPTPGATYAPPAYGGPPAPWQPVPGAAPSAPTGYPTSTWPGGPAAWQPPPYQGGY